MPIRVQCLMLGLAVVVGAQENWPALPAGWTFEETRGVAVDRREHVFVFHRGPHSIVEFDPQGAVLRSWGDGCSFARTR
jgi:hypothetical protein